MLIGCFDESGSSGEGGFVSIAGFVATEERWGAFDTAWNAALAKHSVPYLHTTDLANFKRIYKEWTVDQRRALTADLMGAIWGMGRVVAIGSTMAVDDYNSFSTEQRMKWGDPYYMLIQEVMFGATLEARPDERVRIIYSQQDEFSGKFERLYRVLQHRYPRLDTLMFEDMRTTPGLQAADLLAYELKRFYKNKITRPDIPLRWPMRNILLQQHVLRGSYAQVLALVVSPHPGVASGGIHVPVYAFSDSSGNTCVFQHDNFRMGEPSTDAVNGGQKVPAGLRPRPRRR